MIIFDTGLIVAAADKNDDQHEVAVRLFVEAKLAGERVAVTQMVLAEVCYHLQERAGSAVEAAFLDSIADRSIRLLELDPEDVRNIAALSRRFAGFPLGGTDASVAVAADRYGVKKIATFDRRHFPSLTPRSGGHFELLPESF